MMKCREFENSLSRYFKDVEDFEAYADASATDDWSKFIPVDAFHQSLLRHASTCDDCATSLLWYLDIKDVVDYHEYPCLHLAYFSNSKDDRCIDLKHGLFSIIIDEVTGMVISNCPWCGIRLNTSGVV